MGVEPERKDELVVAGQEEARELTESAIAANPRGGL
jgi:hypothetical protein